MLQSTEEWINLVRGYDAVALIGNSEGVDIDAIVATLPRNTLYVFFTGCAKVLSGPFSGDVVLCHRMLEDGRSFLKSRRRISEARSFFQQGLKGEVGVIADLGRADNAPLVGEARQSPFFAVTLDFDHSLDRFYPADRTPTTGFAVASWILANVPQTPLWLCGFTGVAGTQFHLHAGHDWTFEQTVIELFSRTGRLRRYEEQVATSSGLERIARRFPEFDHGEVALVASHILAKRFNGMERQMKELWSVTKIPRAVSGIYKRLRPKK